MSIHTDHQTGCTCHHTEAVGNRTCITCLTEQVEGLLTSVRAEIGNAGFAVAVSMQDLADEALEVAEQNIATVRAALQGRA